MSDKKSTREALPTHSHWGSKEVLIALITVCGTIVVALIGNAFTSYLQEQGRLAETQQKIVDAAQAQHQMALKKVMDSPQDSRSLDAMVVLSQVGALDDPGGRIGRAASILLSKMDTPKENPSLGIESVSHAPPSTLSARDGANGLASVAPSFIWPTAGQLILPFGPLANGRKNDGINILTRRGEIIHASASGTVTYAGNELTNYGNLVLIKHAGGYTTVYSHADRLLVNRGDFVSRGQAIGLSGSTGDVTTPQLHFEIRKYTTPLDPQRYLERTVPPGLWVSAQTISNRERRYTDSVFWRLVFFCVPIVAACITAGCLYQTYKFNRRADTFFDRFLADRSKRNAALALGNLAISQVGVFFAAVTMTLALELYNINVF